jgi:hypothetical protein
MFKPRAASLSILISIVLLVFILAGCTQPTELPATSTVPAPTEMPTLTPTPEAARLVLLEQSGSVTQPVLDFLTAFSAENGLLFEQVNALDPAQVTPGTRIVVALSQPGNLDELVSGAPQTQFIVAGNVNPSGRTNLSVITSKPEDLAFMGGYLAALIAWDFRAGGLIPNDTSLGGNLGLAFENGGRFWCGQCSPYFSPFYYFPLIAEASANADAATWQAQLGPLVEYLVNTVYVDPAAAQTEVLDSLAAQGMTLVGLSGTPNPDYFTVLLGVDLLSGLQQLLPQALAGTGGTSLGTQVTIVENKDHKLVTQGKSDLFDRMAEQIASGYVLPIQ